MPRSSGCCRRIRCSRRPRATRSRCRPPRQLASAAASSTEAMPAHDDDRAGGKEAGDDSARAHGDASIAPTSRTTPAAIRTGAAAASSDDDDDGFYPQQVATSSLRDHLLSQLAVLNLPLRDRQLVGALIDALDEDGYLHIVARGSRGDVSGGARDRSGRALDRALLPAELRARRHRRARRLRMPRAAVEGAARDRRRSAPRRSRSSPSTCRSSRRAISRS